MSRCGKTMRLEAWVDGELSAVEGMGLKLHVEHCAVCMHEHRWLNTEKVLFAQRADREQARPQWAQFEKMPSRARLWAMTAAVAAGWVLFVLAQWTPPRANAPVHAVDEPEMSMEVSSVQVDIACRTWFGGIGDACGPTVLASFASRD